MPQRTQKQEERSKRKSVRRTKKAQRRKNNGERGKKTEESSAYLLRGFHNASEESGWSKTTYEETHLYPKPDSIDSLTKREARRKEARSKKKEKRGRKKEERTKKKEESRRRKEENRETEKESSPTKNLLYQRTSLLTRPRRKPSECSRRSWKETGEEAGKFESNQRRSKEVS